MPNEERSTYKVLRNEFSRNYLSIKHILKPKDESFKIIPKLTNKKKPFLDLRENYKKFREESQLNTKTIPMQKLLLCVNKAILVASAKRKFNRSTTIMPSKRNSMFDVFIQVDEPIRIINQLEMSRIPYKENLLLSSKLGELFISGIKLSSDVSLLMKNNINAIITIGNYSQISRYPCITGGYLIINIQENDKEMIGFDEHIYKLFKFLDFKLKEGNVLVSCYYGVCRSCAAIIAYLMKRYRIRLERALLIVKSGRTECNLSEAALKILTEIDANIP